MEFEATARQSIERAAAAPVERQKAARLARCSAGDLVTLDYDRLCAASAYKVGDRGTDRASAITMRLREPILLLPQGRLPSF
jgi:hypothetical protein